MGKPETFTLAPDMAPAAPLMRMLAHFDRSKVEAFAEVSIALLDLLDGDPEAEDATNLEDDFSHSPLALRYAWRGPGCAVADSGSDAAWIEWHTMRGSQKRGPNIARDHEDAEDDDPDTSVEDDSRGFDPEQDYGVDDVGECEQMPNDVPMLKVYSAEYNIFTDQRVSFGISNLMSSFVGEGIRSADTGAMHTGKSASLSSKPGKPV